MLSAVLSWPASSVTDRGRRARRPHAGRRPTTDAGSTYPSTSPRPRSGAGRPRLRGPARRRSRSRACSAATASGFIFTTVVAELQRLRRRRRDPRRDDRRRRRRGGRADRRADPQDGRRSRPRGAITFIIVLLGGISSVASDAGYLVLIPLGAAAFVSLGPTSAGRHRGGVRRCQRGVRRQHPDHAGRRHHHRGHQRDDRAASPPTRRRSTSPQNLYFAIASTIFCAIVIDRPHRDGTSSRAWARGRRPSDRRRPGRPRARRRRAAARVARSALRRDLTLVVRSSIVGLLTCPAGRPAAQPRDRRDLRQLAVHEQPALHHHDALPGRRPRLRRGRRHPDRAAPTSSTRSSRPSTVSAG